VVLGKIHAVSSALPDWNKNIQLNEGKGRESKTDVNRSKISKDFMSGDAEWLFQIDDDTTPPQDALVRLLKAQRDFIAGVYFNPRPPFNPIAYIREDDGFYTAVYGYPQGTLIQIDSVGMGCTLIHKSVFQKIYDNHRVFQRQNGSIFAMHNDNVFGTLPADPFVKKTRTIKDGMFSEPVIEVNKDERPFPYYAMEYARTEDHHFCELAASVGVKPWLDTTITCEHWKLKDVGKDDYDQEVYGWIK
jgi:hypothetical protein